MQIRWSVLIFCHFDSCVFAESQLRLCHIIVSIIEFNEEKNEIHVRELYSEFLHSSKQNKLSKVSHVKGRTGKIMTDKRKIIIMSKSKSLRIS